jgi:hypothetical protein
MAVAVKCYTQGRTDQSSKRWGGVRAGDGSSYWVALPSFSTFEMPNDASYYVCCYVGLECYWRSDQGYAEHLDPVSRMECGVSIKGNEFNDSSKRGWYPFVRVYDTKGYSYSYRWSTKLADSNRCTLELRVCSSTPNSYQRWYIDYRINGSSFWIGELWGHPSEPNCFNPKFAVDCEPFGDMNAVKFGSSSSPFDFQRVWALNYAPPSTYTAYLLTSSAVSYGQVCYKATDQTPTWNPYVVLYNSYYRMSAYKPGGTGSTLAWCTR